jgi:hypothetical protein
MANNYLITGYWGEPHVTVENDRGINAAIFGTGRFVLPVGEQFRAEYIGNNTIRMYDGKLMDNGAAAGIPAGEYVDLLIANAGQGKKRNDLIVFQYSKDASTRIETGKFVVIQGTETSGTAADPTLVQADLLSDKATAEQMALWRVSVSGTTISAPVQVFEICPNAANAYATGTATIDTANALGGTIRWQKTGRVVVVDLHDLQLKVSAINAATWKDYRIASGLPKAAITTARCHMNIEAAQSNAGTFRVNTNGEIEFYHHDTTLVRGAVDNAAKASGNIVYISA